MVKFPLASYTKKTWSPEGRSGWTRSLYSHGDTRSTAYTTKEFCPKKRPNMAKVASGLRHKISSCASYGHAAYVCGVFGNDTRQLNSPKPAFEGLLTLPYDDERRSREDTEELAAEIVAYPAVSRLAADEGFDKRREIHDAREHRQSKEWRRSLISKDSRLVDESNNETSTDKLLSRNFEGKVLSPTRLQFRGRLSISSK